MEELLWEKAEWRSRAHDWIRVQMRDLGIRQTGEITQPHIRPWSTVLRVPTSSGDLWFKAGTAALSHEASLTVFLSGLMPEHCPVVRAIDAGQGWMLLEDLGVQLRSAITTVEDLDLWDEPLKLYARLQQRSAEGSDELIETGLMDRRSEGLAIEWEALLRDEEALLVGRPGGLSPAVYEFAQDLWSRVEAVVASAVVPGIPETVVHEDLHDGNVFVLDGRPILSDWGDSSYANPLVTLTVFLRSAAHRRELDIRSAEIERLKSVYVSCWLEYAAEDAIRRAAHHASHMGALFRSLTWWRAIRSSPPGSVSEWIDSVPGWLDEFLAGFAGCPGPRIP